MKFAIGPLKMKKGDVVKTVLEIKSAKMSKLSVQDVIFSYALTVLKHITVNNGFFVLKMDLLYIKTTTKQIFLYPKQQ
jgi:hypothetical protein